MGMTNRDAIEILGELKKCYLGGIVDAIDMAIELLKAQEPVKPVRDIKGIYYCGSGICNTICVGYEAEFTHSIMKVENYCHKCGRKVKWDG